MSDTEQPVSQFKSKSGLRRVFAAFFYSLDGFRAAWRHEHAFRQELMIAVPGIIVALLLPERSGDAVLRAGLGDVGRSALPHVRKQDLVRLGFQRLHPRVGELQMHFIDCAHHFVR
ncbi:MAG: diacylglycerol kinase [Oxalobacteraceae bacterium]|nr:diacylglycerol kinase [Oxalobacteraceae bacterium]